MKQIDFFDFSFSKLHFFICSTGFILYIYKPDIFSTFLLMQQKTHGKNIWNTQQQKLGNNFEEVSLKSRARFENAESATMISHSELVNRLTAPILLPQPTTK